MLKRVFPFLTWLPSAKYTWKKDLIAGFTIGVVLIPQGIAYAILAGVPPIYGLYTALIPQIFYTLFATSKYLAVGPTALDALIMATGISALAIVGTEHYMTMVFVLTLMVGVIQILLGSLKLGFIMNFVSKPVLTGFITAAAIIISISQFKNLMGLDAARSNRFHELVGNLARNLDTLQLESFIIGVLSIIAIFWLKKINKKIPAQLVVVVLGIVVIKYFYQFFSEVDIVGYVPAGLPKFAIPALTYDLFQKLLPIALTLTFTGFLQATTISKALEEGQMDSDLNTNRELIALGMGNFAGSFLSSYVATGSFSRSSLNKEAGSLTPLSNFFAAAFIALTLLLLTPAFYYLPKPILAAIIIVAVVKLINYKEIRFLWKTNRNDFFMMLITFVVTLMLGIREGVLVGVLVSIFVVIYRSSKPHMVVLGRVPGTSHIFRNVMRFSDVITDTDVLILRFDAPLYFANANYFKEKLDFFVQNKGQKLKSIIIDMATINTIDSTGIATLEEVMKKYNARGITFYFTDIKGPVRDYFTKSLLIDEIGIKNCFMNIEEAMAYLNNKREDSSKFSKYIKQTNVKTPPDKKG